MTSKRDKQKQQRAQLNKQLEQSEVKPKLINTWERTWVNTFWIKEGGLNMGMYIVFFVYAVPCILFLLYCLTPKGKIWLRQHNIL